MASPCLRFCSPHACTFTCTLDDKREFAYMISLASYPQLLLTLGLLAVSQQVKVRNGYM